MLLTPLQAFEQHLSNIYLSFEGLVAEIMPDDTIGVKHQRFLVITPQKQTILVVHNLEHQPRLEMQIGSIVKVQGTYIWNRHGGIIHETHSNINKPQPDGKIVVE